MDKNEIITMLSATPSPKQIAQWLRTQYFPEIVSRFNHESSRKRFGLYQNEQLPANERNLTDVRTRMGVLIEFELARISNDLLPEIGITDIFGVMLLQTDYYVVVGNNIDEAVKRAKLQGYSPEELVILNVSRIIRANPKDNFKAFNMFKSVYKKTKCFDLMPAVVNEKNGTINPLQQYAIRKTELHFRNISDIDENDQDAILLDGNKPYKKYKSN